MWVGRISKVSGAAAWVRVPDLGRREYGPVDLIEGVILAVDDRVLVGQLGKQPERIALIRRLP
jgi:hypothetical protein